MSKTYTLEEAAALLGLREEALAPMLPGLGVDLNARRTLTQAEFDMLAAEQQRIAILRTKEGGEYRRDSGG